MQRYFTKQMNLHSMTAILENADFHHVKNVMRMKVSDEIIVCDLNGNCFFSTILAVDSVVKVALNRKMVSTELTVNIDLAQALIRRERFEWVLQKVSELGVQKIIPVKSKYSIISVEDEKASKKVERWNKITKEASEQSHRHHLVKVTDVVNGFGTIDLKAYDIVLVAYEKETTSKQLADILSPEIRNILIIIGPEGGIHEDEVNLLQQVENVYFVGCGKRILRSETASLYLLSVIGYRYELGDLS
jgi:16S rRNA (uracil1498-N3)-methyltransferase